MSTNDSYPRPDFQRSNLRWKSLNGPWSFLFDDSDIGLSEHWHLTGLPSQVTVNISKANTNDRSAAEKITQKIAANPDKLIKDNVFKDVDAGLGEKVNRKTEIVVPYVFQCPASGLNERSMHEVLWYEREIDDFRSEQEERLVLRFGAVDYEASVWVDGVYVGGHRGGHVPFELDVSDAFARDPSSKTKRVTVRVFDSAHDLAQPRGKQYWGAQPESIFYTPSSGIWQSVWLESVPSVRLADSSHGTVLQSNDITTGHLHASIALQGRRAAFPCAVELEASLGGVVVGTKRVYLAPDSDRANIVLDMRLSPEQVQALPADLTREAPLEDGHCWSDRLALWSPEHPLLYDLTIRLFDSAGTSLDEIKTTAGMRSLSWDNGNGTVLLNNKPLFQALVLDQGYWRDTFMTPTSDELKADIQLSKQMGFNGCRKHQKVEDPIFLHWADKLGYLVWGETANAYQFNEDYVSRFNQEWTEAVMRDINHPSIITWTPVNESWGYPDLKGDKRQRDHIRSLYWTTKVLDPTRSINDNCGWEHVCTDLSTFHDYSDGDALAQVCKSQDGIFAPKAGRDIFTERITSSAALVDQGASHKAGAPILCTEFGGVNIALAPSAGQDRQHDWGYTTASDPDDLLKRVERLVQAVVDGGHCCGFVYTQLTDIEQETNGLYSIDRQPKLDVGKMHAILERAKKTYYDSLRRT